MESIDERGGWRKGENHQSAESSMQVCDFLDHGSPSTPGLSMFTSELKNKIKE